jgi:hypothetical protein
MAGDLGTYDANGTRIGQYKYPDSVINSAITSVLLVMTGYSKVSGSYALTPAMTSASVIGELVCRVALELVTADQIMAYRTRNLSVTRSCDFLLAKILGQLNTFLNPNGAVIEKEGALESLYDHVDKIDDFVTAHLP